MTCRIDIEKGIIKDAFNVVNVDKVFTLKSVEGKYDTFYVANRKTDKNNFRSEGLRQQAHEVAFRALDTIRKTYNGYVAGYIDDNGIDAIKVVLSVNPSYIEHEFEKIQNKEAPYNREADAAELVQAEKERGQYADDLQGEFYQADNNAEPIPEDLGNTVNEFLASIGVNVKVVDAIKDSMGNPLDVVSKASMLNKTIEVLSGRANVTTLPEEAAHFFVELLGESHPLYQQMFNEINKYAIYGDVVAQYKNLKSYRNADGSVNFTKLKKEAMGKMIASYIVNPQTANENPANLVKAQKWWEKVWAYLTKIFSKNPSNPFKDAAQRIVNNNTKGLKKIGELDSNEEFYQVDNVVSKIRADQQRIHLDNSIDPKTKEKKHIYTVDGKPIVDKYGNGRSVTSVEVDKFYKDRFPTDNRNERQKNIDKLKAEEGDNIHDAMEKIFKMYVDPTTGVIRSTPTTMEANSVPDVVREKLNNHVKNLIASYPAGTRFLTENKIYDSKRNIAGSIDLLVILPDGSADIYDWKSQEIPKGHSELKWFKEPAYRIQLAAYRRILGQEYGITKFNKVRAVPIATTFAYSKNNGIYTPARLSDIEIGGNPTTITESKSYLLPVVSESDSTGDAEMDKLVAQLYGIYESVSLQSTGKDKYIKAEELNRIKKAIRDLQVKQDIRSFVENGLAETQKYNKKLKEDTITSADILEAKDIINVYVDSGVLLREQLKKLNKQIDEATGAEKERLQKLQDDFLVMVANARDIEFRLKEKTRQLGVKIAEKNGIMNLLNAERSMDKLKVLFRSLSTLPTRALKTFHKLLAYAQGQRDIKIDEMNNELGKIQEDMTKWAAAKGLTERNMFDGILKFDENGNWTGDFLDKYSKEFYEKRNEAIKNNNPKWIMDNTDFDVTRYEKDLAAYKQRLQTIVYSTDDRTDFERKEKALAKWIESRDVRTSEYARVNKKNYYLRPKESWQSSKWKELNDDNNKPLKAAYEYFQKIKSLSEELGMIEFNSGFIPSVRQDKVELLVFNGLNNIFSHKGLFESLQTDSDKFFGEIDPITGELVKKIPVSFINDLGIEKENGVVDYSMKSKDLFKVFSIWGSHTYNYEAMQSIKDSAEILVDVERSKKSLVTNLFGKVTKDKKEKTGNDVNADALENFVKYYVYGQSMGDNADYVFNIGGKEYSGVKAARAVISFMSLKTLGLNTLSGTATFVGGTGNALFQSSKRLIFTEKDWANGMRDLTSRNPILLAANGFFQLGIEDEKRRASNSLSVSATVKNFDLNHLFIIQRTGDKGVQYGIQGAMLRSHMIENNEIVEIEKFVKDKHDYFNKYYNLSSAEQKELRDIIDKEVGELKATRSLTVVGKVVNDQLEFPGIERNSDTAIAFRNKVLKVTKNVLGNSTHDDINQIRIGLLGQVLMQFRSWMPQMVTERFGDMSFDTDLDAYQYGKARLFFSHLADKKFLPLIGELLTGFSGNTISKAKEEYIKFKVDAEEKGEDFDMSEGAFIDMYLGNLRSMVRELAVLSVFMALVFWIKPGDDDEPDKSGVRKYIAKAFNKYQNEFSFFYSPTDFTQMIKSPVPIISLLTDFQKFITGTMGQMWGFTTQDEDLMQKSHPLTTLGKIMPITKEAQSIYALFDDDFSKDWGIRNR